MLCTLLKRIPGYHQVSSSKKASKLHPGYNVYPVSNAFEQPEQVYVKRERKEISFNKAIYIYIYRFTTIMY